MKAIDTRTALSAAFFTVAPALLATITPTLALACLPLLASLFALRRGHSWGAFALLGGATCLAAMGITEILPWPAALASGGALLTCGVVVPHLWRFDKAATAIVMTLTMVLGTAAGAFVEKSRSTAAAPDTASERSSAEVPSAKSEFQGTVELADVVGVYQRERGEVGNPVLTLNAIGRATLEDGKILDGRFVRGGEGRIEVELGDKTIRLNVGDGVLVGPQGQLFRRMGAE